MSSFRARPSKTDADKESVSVDPMVRAASLEAYYWYLDERLLEDFAQPRRPALEWLRDLPEHKAVLAVLQPGLLHPCLEHLQCLMTRGFG